MLVRSLGHRAPLLWIVLPWIGGMMTAKALGLGAAGWPLAAAAGLAGLSVIARHRSPQFWALMLTGTMFLAGLACFSLTRAPPPGWQARPPREVRLSIRVERVFAQADRRRAAGL